VYQVPYDVQNVSLAANRGQSVMKYSYARATAMLLQILTADVG